MPFRPWRAGRGWERAVCCARVCKVDTRHECMRAHMHTHTRTWLLVARLRLLLALPRLWLRPPASSCEFKLLKLLRGEREARLSSAEGNQRERAGAWEDMRGSGPDASCGGLGWGVGMGEGEGWGMGLGKGQGQGEGLGRGRGELRGGHAGQRAALMRPAWEAGGPWHAGVRCPSLIRGPCFGVFGPTLFTKTRAPCLGCGMQGRGGSV